MDDYKSYIYPRNDIFCDSRTNKHEKSDQVEKRNRGEHFWRDNENSPLLHTWRGRAFENACLYHVNQIKTALGVSGVSSENASWTMQGAEDQKQIDLIINRSDH